MMKTRYRSHSFLAFILTAALVTCNAADEPSAASTKGRSVKAESLLSLIKTTQEKHVRRSYGIAAGACFTDAHLASFREKQVPVTIVEALKKSDEFIAIVAKIHALDPEARKALLGKARKSYSLTWAQLGKISPEGQTEAGQAAEKAIAEAITEYVAARVKVLDEAAKPKASADDHEASQKPAPTGEQAPWKTKVQSIRWIAYAPSNADPTKGIDSSPQSVRMDLWLLRQAGFTGLVTYSVKGVMGQTLTELAVDAGFEGIVPGLWNPKSETERAVAERLAHYAIVLGFCVGNEGLDHRYTFEELSDAINQLRQTTGKLVTTTEELGDYDNPQVIQVGDWVFPNVHPYFAGKHNPKDAVTWTQHTYAALATKTSRFVWLKEVGLPTEGADGEELSEENQAAYYEQLAQTNVMFTSFEAFDQPWKDHLPVEPHWGLFHSDRTPKELAWKWIERQQMPRK